MNSKFTVHLSLFFSFVLCSPFLLSHFHFPFSHFLFVSLTSSSLQIKWRRNTLGHEIIDFIFWIRNTLKHEIINFIFWIGLTVLLCLFNSEFELELPWIPLICLCSTSTFVESGAHFFLLISS